MLSRHGVLCSLQQPIQKPLGLFSENNDVGADILDRPQWLRLVEAPSETHLISDLSDVLIDPRIRRVGQHFSTDEGFDAALVHADDCRLFNRSNRQHFQRR